MCNVYEFQNDSFNTIFGDFNARVSNLDVFIAGIDNVPERDVVDFSKKKTKKKKKQCCDVFVDFSLVQTLYT